MGVVLVGGVHGVGKTTTIEKARHLSTKDAPLLKGSEILSRLLNVSTEDIPFVDPGLRAIAREQMYRELALSTNGIRDCHYCTYSETGYEFPFETKGSIGAVAVAVMLEASPTVILDRRLSIDRDRPTDPSIILEQLQLEHEGAQRAAQRLGVELLVVKNEVSGDADAILAEIFNTYLD